MMRRLLSLLPFALLPLLAYLALFHAETLLIDNPGWLIRGTDNGENALGLHAYLRDAGAGWSLRTALLNTPDGVPLLFTDSNPLLGLLAKPFAPLLPPDAQFVGVWILLCFVLQTLFAWLLLRRHAPSALALWVGVAFLAFPPTLANRFIHANLMAHWVILAALWLFLEPERGARLRWWAALIAVTALVHSYLLVMVGAIWASAMLTRFVRSEWHGFVAVIGQVAAIGFIVLVAALWLGVAGDFVPAGNYGAFAMPLDALWNPGNATYSNVLPAVLQREGRGFEGFQYLGLGGLILFVLAVITAWQQPVAGPEREVRRRLLWLVPALVVLTLLAVGNRPDLAGIPLTRFELPQDIIDALDAVRASGRLFWPVGYTLILIALLALFRLPQQRAGLILAGLLAVQLADISGMAQAIHATSSEAPFRHRYVRTVDPRWDSLIASARDVAFVPGDVTKDLGLFQEVAWRAVLLGRPTTSVYAARTSRTTAARLAREESAFARGELVPGRLYVLLPTAPLPPAATARVTFLDGVVVIRPLSRAAPRPAPSPPGSARAAGSARRSLTPPRSGR
ncbi:MAG: DUF6311 domain-containing protein [Pseudomonadota bacterium]